MLNVDLPFITQRTEAISDEISRTRKLNKGEEEMGKNELSGKREIKKI